MIYPSIHPFVHLSRPVRRGNRAPRLGGGASGLRRISLVTFTLIAIIIVIVILIMIVISITL